ncbi:DUF11 domain-containing protein [Crenothrix sp.]|uniref:DUF11 domain-containing protein n=1 Tax=Crenothrix sp. TaxID=3100433 RepID=UPI00374C8D3E
MSYSSLAVSASAVLKTIETISNQAIENHTDKSTAAVRTAQSNIVSAIVTEPPPPEIKVEKTSLVPVPVNGYRNTYDIAYTVKISNIGTVPAHFIRLVDNLNCTFRTYENPAPVTTWSLTQKPKLVSGLLRINPNYTGDAPCPSGVSSYDTNTKVQMVDGSVDLLPTESATIEYSVRVTLLPGLSRAKHEFKNVVIGASMKGPTSQSGRILSSSASTPSVPVDPSGVVYNSVTRKPVPGAIVALVRDSCPKTRGPITVADIFNPSRIDYTYNADGSVSMITPTDGGYSFFLNTADDCKYHIVVTPPANSGLISPSVRIPVKPGIAPAGNVQLQAGAPADGEDTTYYLNFQISVNSDVFNNHIPLDPVDSIGEHQLFLNKEGSKISAELGDIIPYTLTLNNISGRTLDNVQINDVLPRGFRLLSGSARLGGKAVPDPIGTPGAPLNFNLTDLNWENGQQLILTYQLQIGVGAALDKSSVNRAQAVSGLFTSNLSSWAVTVSGGVFSDDAYLVGKVYLEGCPSDKVQNNMEVGVPGVRLLMEDGTSVVTDVEGKYSLYGLSPITHVLKLDSTTLPGDAKLIALSNRNSGKGDSRFVDLKKGELHKADFAVNSCDADAVVEEVKNRRKALEAQPLQDGVGIIGQRFNPDYSEATVSDRRSLPATGVITPSGPQAIININNNNNVDNINKGSSNIGKINNGVYQTVVPWELTQSLAAQRLQNANPQRPSVITLEELIKNLNNTPGFIGLKEGDTLPVNVVNVQVKGMLGSTLRLKVNGEEESLQRVGKKSKVADKQLEAWEYIGVNLHEGKNTLVLEVADTFGNVRKSEAITVIAPGQAGELKIDAPATSPADSKTPVKIKISLLDDNGVPVTVRTPLTLDLDQGTWVDEDLNPNEPGTQAFITGGTAEFSILPPGAPTDAIVQVSAGNLQQQVRIAFLPELRPLVGAGIIEGVVNFSKSGKINVNAPRAYDTFERELRNLSVSGTDVRATGRAAFFFKGTIKGKYLLTASYDSDKKTNERLFRDIQPDKFYPIYGDSSLKGFDAQSTQRYYLRVDRERSYLLYGDFTTTDNSSIDRKLSQYSRSATGLKGHYENGRFMSNAWGSYDSLAQVVIEIPANGTSGPYRLPGTDTLYENSEKVEVLVRDRNQPTLIIESRPMSRFVDYSIDLVTKEIFFKGPVASLDENLNPRTIRITYESTKGGKDFFKGGVDGRMKVTDNIELGASYARDDNPQQKTQVMGGTAIVKLGEKTTMVGEVARTVTGASDVSLNGGQNNSIGSAAPSAQGLNGLNIPGYINQNTAGIEGEGLAERIEIRHEGTKLKATAQITHADKNFNNPTAGISNGRTEATANARYKINEQASLVAQGVYSKDSRTKGMRAGLFAGIEYAFNQLISAQFGMRAVHQDLAGGQLQSFGITTGSTITGNGQQSGLGAGSGGTSFGQTQVGFAIAQPQGNSLIGTPSDLITVRGKLAAQLPWIKGADVYTEVEQDVLDINKHLFAVGAGYLVNDKTRLYGRYEFISSLNSPFALNSTQQNSQAVVGVESAYSKNGRLFSEYRLRDAINGREAQAAMGLRQTWELAKGLRLGGGLETTKAFAGQPGSDSTAITALAEYTGDPRYKLTGSLEARFASTGNSWLNTLGLAYKINQDWSMLARNGLSVQENSFDHSELWRTRQQIGFAWRQVNDNRWNALGRYEHRMEEQKGGIDPYREKSHIVSTHINYQPRRDLIASGRYAVKWSDQKRDNVNTNSLTQLIYGRTTWDFLPDWDISLQSGVLKDEHAIQFGAGMELGYQAVNDLWVSVGYNMQGFDGGDLKGTDYTAQGFYVRMRFKFDEGLFN